VPAATWLSHLGVKDAKATAAQVASLGGKVMKDVFKVGEFGQMAVVIDPHGAALALWQSAKAEAQPAPVDGSFVWNELSSADPDASVKFYRAIGGFGLQSEDMEGFGTYHMLTSDGAPCAGIAKQSMPGQPHAWLPYVQVASADATVEKAKKLRANVIVPPTDIPGVGRFAILLDPQGAAIGLLQPPPR
jgi:predicted enzyme related to lactoylglutathione lyase